MILGMCREKNRVETGGQIGSWFIAMSFARPGVLCLLISADWSVL